MMVSQRDKKLVVIQLSGGNDCLDTVVPYSNGLYYDFRPTVHIAPEAVLPINDQFGFHPSMGAIKNLWDAGKVAIINGIGYPNPNRSHFRSLDIWHTAEPDKIGTEGWLGRVIRELDPKSENVLTGINFGRGLPRALGLRGVPVASVGNLDTYGLFPDLQDEALKKSALATFNKMYGSAAGRDVVFDYLGQTGADVLKGADVLRQAPAQYASSVNYPDNPVAHNLKAIAQVLLADIGTRIYYTTHASFDTHSGELPTHAQLWEHVDSSVGSFMEDLKVHDRLDDTVIFIFSEFGRRVRDNGSGSDHGSGGVAFVIGDSVRGGMYGEYPSLEEKDQLEGDLHFNNDFRSSYATLLEQWMGMESAPIVNGHFEQFDFLKPAAA